VWLNRPPRHSGVAQGSAGICPGVVISTRIARVPRVTLYRRAHPTRSRDPRRAVSRVHHTSKTHTRAAGIGVAFAAAQETSSQ